MSSHSQPPEYRPVFNSKVLFLALGRHRARSPRDENRIDTFRYVLEISRRDCRDSPIENSSFRFRHALMLFAIIHSIILAACATCSKVAPIIASRRVYPLDTAPPLALRHPLASRRRSPTVTTHDAISAIRHTWLPSGRKTFESNHEGSFGRVIPQGESQRALARDIDPSASSLEHSRNLTRALANALAHADRGKTRHGHAIAPASFPRTTYDGN